VLVGLLATKAVLDREMGGAINDGINKFYKSTFFDITASKNNKGAYRCEKVKVRSTGNSVVDRVRQRLSYNDIQVTRNPSVWKDAKSTNEGAYTSFNNELFHILTSEVTNQVSCECNCSAQTL
jgi:hypothetical protein